MYTNRTKCNENFPINEKSKHLIHFLLHVIFGAGRRYKLSSTKIMKFNFLNFFHYANISKCFNHQT